MRSITRKTFSAELKLEAAQLVLDKNHTIIQAAKAMNVGKSTMDKWGEAVKIRTPGWHSQSISDYPRTN
jgi:transposase-like protein